MTCVEKLRATHPGWDEKDIQRKIKYSCPSDHNIELANSLKSCRSCDECWNSEAVDSIPHEFEYLSKWMVYDENVDVKMRNERVWVTALDRMYKHHYTGKPYFRIRTESESGGVWEGWVTEEDIREMLEERVSK